MKILLQNAGIRKNLKGHLYTDFAGCKMLLRQYFLQQWQKEALWNGEPLSAHISEFIASLFR